MDLETRTIDLDGLELRAGADDDARPTIGGYGAVFDSPSLDLGGFRETIAPGAFSRTLKARGGDILSFFNHNPNMPLGSRRAGSLTVEEDDKGLIYSVTPPDTTYAADLVAAMRAKLVRGSSFSFYVRKDAWTEVDGTPVRTLLDIDLEEVGPVTMPAYPKATSQVRAMLEARGISLPGNAPTARALIASSGVDLDELEAILARQVQGASIGTDQQRIRDLVAYLACLNYAEPGIEAPAWKVPIAHRKRRLELLERQAGIA